MKCSSQWSRQVYRPMERQPQGAELLRLAPGRQEIAFDYRADGPIQVHWRGASQGMLPAAGGRGVISGLLPDAEYELGLALPGQTPHSWAKARTGFAPGKVVNYLHPDDERYAFSGRYLCSPSLAKLPGGRLVVSMDVYAPDQPQNLTLLFSSDDGGESWQPLCQLFPCFWGKLFVHRGELYMLAASTEYGDLLIGKSVDGGATWAAPTRLLYGSGRSWCRGVHKAPMPVVETAGMLYTAVEWGSWAQGGHASAMLTAPADSDLLEAGNWHCTALTGQSPDWKGAPQGPAKGVLEGNAVVGFDGKVYNLLRYAIGGCAVDHDRAVLLSFSGRDEPQRFERIVDFPGGVTKFCIQRDDKTGCYVAAVNRVTDPRFPGARTVLSLGSSKDLIHWQVHRDLIDDRGADPQQVGFQYPDFIIDGEDLLLVSRTALNQAHSFHDSNYTTFHRVACFRTIYGESAGW